MHREGISEGRAALFALMYSIPGPARAREDSPCWASTRILGEAMRGAGRNNGKVGKGAVRLPKILVVIPSAEAFVVSAWQGTVE